MEKIKVNAENIIDMRQHIVLLFYIVLFFRTYTSKQWL